MEKWMTLMVAQQMYAACYITDKNLTGFIEKIDIEPRF